MKEIHHKYFPPASMHASQEHTKTVFRSNEKVWFISNSKRNSIVFCNTFPGYAQTYPPENPPHKFL